MHIVATVIIVGLIALLGVAGLINLTFPPRKDSDNA